MPDGVSPLTLRAYRAASVYVGVALVSFGLYDRITDPHLLDPVGVRLLLAAVAFGGLAASYASAAVRRHYRPFVYGLVVAALAFVVWLCVVNRFDPPHAAATMLAVSAFGLAGTTRENEREIALCLGALVLALLLAVALIADPIVNPWGYAAALVATSLTAYLVVRARVRARTELAEREARYRSVVEHTPEGIVIFDAETRCLLEANGAFCRLLGYEPADVHHLRFDDLVETDRGGETVAASVARARAAGHFVLGLTRYRRKDGSPADLEVSGSVVAVAGRDVLSLNLHDATDRRRAEAELLAAKAHTEELLRAKEALLGNMSHEIRTPLTAIIGFAEILREDVAGGEQRDHLEIIERSARRLYDTLNSVLDLAQLEGGGVALRREPLDLVAEAAAAAELLRPLALRKGLTLVVEGPGAPVAVSADGTALSRVLANLVGNAVKFTSAGGVTVGVSAGADGAYVRIRDTGIGIAPSFLPSLFEDFRQASQGYERSHEGNGLGLAIARRLAVLMGGAITVESVLGAGTTFTVRLPAA